MLQVNIIINIMSDTVLSEFADIEYCSCIMEWLGGDKPCNMMHTGLSII